MRVPITKTTFRVPRLLTEEEKPLPLQAGHWLLFDGEARLKVFSAKPMDSGNRRYRLRPKDFRTQSEGCLLHSLQTFGLKPDQDTRIDMIACCLTIIEMGGLTVDPSDCGEPLDKEHYIRLKERNDLGEIYLLLNKVNGALVFCDGNPLGEQEPPNRAPTKSPFGEQVVSPDKLKMWLDQVHDLLNLAGRQQITQLGDSPVEAVFLVK